LSRFDPQTETFTPFAVPEAPATAKGRFILQSLHEDRSGFLWLGFSSGNSLYRLDPANGDLKAYEINSHLPPDSDTSITTIYRNPAGIFWLGGSRGLFRFDPSNGPSTHYPQPRPNGLPTDIRAIAADRSGSVWLAGTDDVGNFFDPVTGKFANPWPADVVQRGVTSSSVFAGPDGVIWRGTPKGLALFDPATGASAAIHHQAADRHSLSGNEVLSMAPDRDGNLWIGTKEGGVSRFSPASLHFGAWRRDASDSRSLSDENIRAIYTDRSGVLWLGTYNGGLNRYDAAQGRFTHFRHDARNPASIDEDRVYSIYEDRAGDLWIGTGVGINRLDRKSGRFEHFKRGDVDKLGTAIPTYWFLEDRREKFWFGTGTGKAFLDRKSGAVTPQTFTSLSLIEDRQGNLWFGESKGLAKQDQTGKVRIIPWPAFAGPVSQIQINFMHEDDGGLLWLATERGLLRFDPKAEAFSYFTASDGLPDNVVQCILPDRSGHLWLSTNNGLSRFNPRDNSFVNYHESDGLQGDQFNRKSCSMDAAGNMYFGGLRGFNVFDPGRVPAKPQDAGRVVFTELRVRGRNVPVQPNSVLPKPIWEMDALNLSHTDEEFSVDFAALSYRDQAKTRYRFRLDNLESQWTEVDSRNRSARYTGIPPGNYRFRVQASTDGRAWNGPETSIGVSMAPPWWNAPWTRGGAILASAALLFGLYKWRTRTLKQRGVQLENLVTQRTAELVEARNQAEQANRAKSTFLANMSHELRTPLNAILGFSHLLRQKNDSPEQQKDLDIINRSGEHLLTLINDVLDIAKIEAGRASLDFRPARVQEVVRDATEMMSVRAAEKDLALHIESGELPPYVYTDPAKLREVLINLLGNAIKFTEKGSITLRVGSRPADSPGSYFLSFEVEDTGIGISAADQQRIFQPFEQAAEASRQKGTGLGLAITQRVVELMGGTIDLKSVPGEGSRFRLEIPVKAAGEQAPEPDRNARVECLEADQPEYRILIVEDQAENWMVLQRLLESARFKVRVARNGEKGLEEFRQWHPQFIWMDLRMPGIDGVELTKQIRALDDGQDVKIAAVTASGLETDRGAVLAAGMDDYVRKPYRPEEILECMRRHLGLRYRSVDTSPEKPEARRAPLRVESLAQLPAELRQNLRNALLTLDSARIADAIASVASHDAGLGGVLSEYAAKHAVSPILKAIDAAQQLTLAEKEYQRNGGQQGN